MVNSLVVKIPQPILDSNLRFSDEVIETKEVTVTRQRCINPTVVDSFLRILRHSSDDIIKQRLNDYSRRNKRNSPIKQSCEKFLNDELYPNWRVRNQVIDFCRNESLHMKEELDFVNSQNPGGKNSKEFNLRMDPYAEQDQLEKKQVIYSDWNRLEKWIKNNDEIENILQGTSNRILREICNDNEDYLQKFILFNKSIKK